MFIRLKPAIIGVASACLLSIGLQTQAAVQFDQDITPEVIFGSGNANGAFTTDRSNGVELGLRGKLRYDVNGLPADTATSLGMVSGSYTAPGVPGVDTATATIDDEVLEILFTVEAIIDSRFQDRFEAQP